MDPEPPAGSDDSDSPTGGLSGFMGFMGSTPRVIGAITALIGALSGLLLALNKAGILGNGGPTSSTPGTTTVAEPFGPNGQGGGDGDVELKDGALYVTANEPGHGVRVLADPESTSTSTTLTARARWVEGERDWSFALVCRFQGSRNFYLLGVIPIKHQYNIARYRDGRLTSLSGLQRSDAIRGNDNRVTARCIGKQPTTLTLKVNGETLPSVRDPNGLEYGNVGIRVGSSVGVVTCAFSELELTPPL